MVVRQVRGRQEEERRGPSKTALSAGRAVHQDLFDRLFLFCPTFPLSLGDSGARFSRKSAFLSRPGTNGFSC